MKAVEHALQRLDQRTQEWARMAAAEATDPNRSSSSNLITTAETLTFLTGYELRKDFRKWIAPPDPSSNFNRASDVHHEGTAAWCTKGSAVAAWKTSGSLLWIHGKRTYPITVLVLVATTDSAIYSWLWKEYSQVRYCLRTSCDDIKLI